MMDGWYADLVKPPLTPPSWVFSPVWTVLYIMIGVSIFLYYRTPGRENVGVTTAILVVHLAANFIWSWLFFGLRSPGLALLGILVLDATLIALIPIFWKTNRIAGGLLAPYLAWVLFATYLNGAIYWLN